MSFPQDPFRGRAIDLEQIARDAPGIFEFNDQQTLAVWPEGKFLFP